MKKNTMGLLAFLFAIGVCDCDPADLQKIAVRECGLCREADKQPAGAPIFFLKDINPRKPNRWLALPRGHGKAHHPIFEMTPAERAALWSAAIAKAKELWGDEWGLAINGDRSRTQCHAHIHIGKFVTGAESANFIVVNGPEEIPAPPDGSGVWVHPAGNKLHVHLNEQITETVLMR
jgi:hypothetical protein